MTKLEKENILIKWADDKLGKRTNMLHDQSMNQKYLLSQWAAPYKNRNRKKIKNKKDHLSPGDKTPEVQSI